MPLSNPSAVVNNSGYADSYVIAPSVVAIQLLPGSRFRKGATIWNDSENEVYIKLGVDAPAFDNFSIMLIPGSYYEVPFNYTGAIMAIWTQVGDSDGSLFVTEFR